MYYSILLKDWYSIHLDYFWKVHSIYVKYVMGYRPSNHLLVKENEQGMIDIQAI